MSSPLVLLWCVRMVEARTDSEPCGTLMFRPKTRKRETMSDGEDMEIEIEGMDVCRSTSVAESAVSDDRSDSGSCKNYDSEDQVDVDESIPLDHDFLRRKRLLSSIPDKPKQAAWIDTLIRLEKLDNVSVEITESNPFDVLVCIFDADGELRGSFKWWDVPLLLSIHFNSYFAPVWLDLRTLVIPPLAMTGLFRRATGGRRTISSFHMLRRRSNLSDRSSTSRRSCK